MPLTHWPEDSLDVGAVQYFRFAPSNNKWLPLTGGTYNYNDYPALAQKYGVFSGTFALENCEGIPVFSADGTNFPGSITGSDTASLAHTHGTTASTNTVADHSHGVGTIAGANAGEHNHGGVTSTVTETPVGFLSLTGRATQTHNHTISTDGAHQHIMSGSTANAGSHAHTVTVNEPSALTTVDKRPKRFYCLLYIKAIP